MPDKPRTRKMLKSLANAEWILMGAIAHLEPLTTKGMTGKSPGWLHITNEDAAVGILEERLYSVHEDWRIMRLGEFGREQLRRARLGRWQLKPQFRDPRNARLDEFGEFMAVRDAG